MVYKCQPVFQDLGKNKFNINKGFTKQAFISISPDSHLKNSDNAVIQLNELGSVQVYFL